jgi:hypothetical protein
MKTILTPGAKLALALCGATIAAVSLAACNPPAQTSDASAPLAAAPPPTPPTVPQYNRTAEQEQRWRRYLAMKQAYEAQLARARGEGRREQAAMDNGRQTGAFDAGRRDQATTDYGRRDGDPDRRDPARMDDGRQGGDQARMDYGHQGGPDTGRRDPARIELARRDFDQASRRAQSEPDPRRRAEMIDQARANLTAAEQGR